MTEWMWAWAEPERYHPAATSSPSMLLLAWLFLLDHVRGYTLKC